MLPWQRRSGFGAEDKNMLKQHSDRMMIDKPIQQAVKVEPAYIEVRSPPRPPAPERLQGQPPGGQV